MYNPSPVNRRVVGSSPTWGAQKSPENQRSGLSLCHFLQGKKRKKRPVSGSNEVQIVPLEPVRMEKRDDAGKKDIRTGRGTRRRQKGGHAALGL
jgi:hypothetical protein